MPHRAVLTDRQRSALFDLPTDEPSLGRHYTLADGDLEYIYRCRRDENSRKELLDVWRTATRTALDSPFTETLDNRVTRFVWLRQSEPGNNAAIAGCLEFLQDLGLSEQILEDLPAHRVARLKRQGERHFPDGLREIGRTH